MCAHIFLFLLFNFSFYKKYPDHPDQTRNGKVLHPDHSPCPPLTTLTKIGMAGLFIKTRMPGGLFHG
jgi:hypothetical protein